MRKALSRFLVLPEFGSRKFWGRLGILGGYLVLLALWAGLGLPCWVQAVFAIPCPGCGMTRGVTALLRLDIPGAFGWHLGVWSLPVLVWGLFTDGRVFRNGKGNKVLWILVGLSFALQWGRSLVLW